MKTEYPRISIVTPVYNQARFIEQTIRSVLDQKYPNLEYIIIDGGSTDGTIDIIRKYESSLAALYSGPDNGMYHALDKGLKMTTGEIMAWINADDVYHPGAFFNVAEIFSRYDDVELLMGQPTTLDESGRFVRVGPLMPWGRFDYLIEKNTWIIQQESTFWRRPLWERTGSYIDTTYKLAADSELWSRFLIKGHAKLHMTNALIGGFRMRKDQLSSNKSVYNKELETIYGKVQITEKDQKILNEINRLKKLTGIPVLRSILGWNDQLKKLFGNPEMISYDLVRQEFRKR